MQYYTGRIDISGDAYTGTAKFHNLQMAKKTVDFNLVVSQRKSRCTGQ